jgi:hypothetical protein
MHQGSHIFLGDALSRLLKEDSFAEKIGKKLFYYHGMLF